jgi:hypothetical protein
MCVYVAFVLIAAAHDAAACSHPGACPNLLALLRFVLLCHSTDPSGSSTVYGVCGEIRLSAHDTEYEYDEE